MTGSFDQHPDGSILPDAHGVAVLGCGNMGSAMARALLAVDRRVVVWNRTSERADTLAADGAEVRSTPDEALADVPLAILCLRATDDVRSVLDNVVPERLAGRTILNVTSGTPEDARTMHDWAQVRGFGYLDAAIGAYPEQIGHQDTRILVAGNEELWSANKSVIRTLAGSSMYVGANPSAANAIDAALTGAFYISSLVSFIEAARFTGKFGVSHETLSDLAEYAVSQLDGELKHVLGRIATGDFSTDQATLDVYADAAGAFAAGLNEQSNASMVRTTAQVLRRAVEAGLGPSDISALVTLES